MYLEGARWNYNSHKLDYSKNRELYTEVPLIHMIPVVNRKILEIVNFIFIYCLNFNFLNLISNMKIDNVIFFIFSNFIILCFSFLKL